MSSSQRQLLWIARIEGVSFLLLLGVAMPLKYLAGQPQVVRVAGGLHGLLFIGFVIALARVASQHAWRARRIATWLGASVVPLALFFLERDLRRDG